MNRHIENYNPLFIGILIVGFLFILAFQGFDVCDEGWYMTFYQQIFNAPETVEYNFAFWLTGIVGGLWYEFFPNGGILSFRFLAIICITATFFLSYRILIKYLPKAITLVGLLMVLIVNDFGFLAFYYNQLSAFLSVLIVFFVLKGLNKNNNWYLILAGFFTAVNVFSRLPNVLLFAFILVFPIQLLWNKNLKINRSLSQMGFFIVGSFFGFILIAFVMSSLGHIHIMENVIQGLLNKSENIDSNHNISRLFKTYKNNYLSVIKSGLKLSFILLVFVFILNKLVSNKIARILLYAITSIALGYIFKTESIYILYYLSILGVFGILFLKYFDSSKKTIAFLALVMMFLLPIGSDGGISNVGYVSIWLAFPLGIYFCLELSKIKNNFPSLNNYIQFLGNCRNFEKTIFIIILVFFTIKLYNISMNAYFDPGSRFKKTFSVNTTLSKGVYTTKMRADIINDVLVNLKDYVSEDDYLLAYDNIPILNYLTKTKPYMYISWVWVYDSNMFKKQLLRAENEIPILPIVVQQKFRTIGHFYEPVSDYMLENKREDYVYKRGRVKAMNAFLERNNYEVVWSNKYFNILKANLN